MFPSSFLDVPRMRETVVILAMFSNSWLAYFRCELFLLLHMKFIYKFMFLLAPLQTSLLLFLKTTFKHFIFFSYQTLSGGLWLLGYDAILVHMFALIFVTFFESVWCSSLGHASQILRSFYHSYHIGAAVILVCVATAVSPQSTGVVWWWWWWWQVAVSGRMAASDW